jgi:hypothetical protein
MNMSSPSSTTHLSKNCSSTLSLPSKSAPLLISLASLFVFSCAKPPATAGRDSRVYEAWDVINQPTRFGRQFETRYENMPKSGMLGKIPWSDYYWPTQRAGIAFRWQMPGSQPFGYSLPGRQSVADMSREDLARLSPAEKLDIYMGRFDFPTVNSERKRTYPGAAAWEGLCHGWAPAALEFAEPHAVTVEGSGGLRIPFGSSDVKAILTWYMATRSSAVAVGLGARCNLGGSIGMSTSPCRDANAGAFHIVMSNMLGRFKEGFIIDLARAAEIWNQPVYGFRSRELSRQGASPGAAPGTRQEVVVESEVYYTIEIEPQWNALGQMLERPAVNSIVYRYRLELDSQGLIRGGEWLQEARPDFLWLQQHNGFADDANSAAIEKIFRASLQ